MGGPGAVVVVVVAGPQASGKSAISAALSADLRRGGESVALVALDQIAAMALPTLPDWRDAHAIFASVTGQWARTRATCVVAEGSGSSEEVAQVRAQVPEAVEVLTVAVSTSLPIAVRRAQADPSRGVSKEYSFLEGVYERWPDELRRLGADVVVDSGALSVEQEVAVIRRAIGAARASREASRSA